MDPNKLKALLTYVFELFWILINVVVLVLWVPCLLGKSEYCYFSKIYLDEGFCNAPDGHTQFACGLFDLTTSTATFVLLCCIIKGSTNLVGLLGAGYTVVHGATHLVFAFHPSLVDNVVGPLGYVILAIILAIGALGVGYLIYESTSKIANAVAVGIVAEVLMVVFFWVFVKEGKWVLTCKFNNGRRLCNKV